MKIVIQEKDLEKPLVVKLPNFLLNGHFIGKYFGKNEELEGTLKQCTSSLVSYAKEYGSFSLVQIEEADGTKVEIIV